VSTGGGAKDGDVYILSKADLVAAFDLWTASYGLEPETVPEAVARMQSETPGEAYAETLLAFLAELANTPDVELP
jgi:hypothetical protein